MNGLMVLDGGILQYYQRSKKTSGTTLASRDHGGTGPSSAGPSLEPQTGPPLRGAPIRALQIQVGSY